MEDEDVVCFRIVFEGGATAEWSWTTEELKAEHPVRLMVEDKEAKTAMLENRPPRRIVAIERRRPS